ncbi:hypothetical protein MX824_004839 [Vibrio parahaemolyticus]|uniref:hypothetical protein n=1 Tax=Vibrio parahaemolyticus TaxID=670 RepID=UPI00040E4B72|nr:hypothetical protein [Vibrio parahaemolyticus]EJC6766194.1 hypothetical protein [Vibrio parahaemolyticus]EJC6784980.1 hypothetical protein [Vibrio parahaemolyticus]EJC6813312.1 hypothetical protein [Vibrio parahaemolyticus]EJC6927957.1 hypothetical protein [Vibrio parahaemolyticus]EJC6942299.1 hypothetical protein [Vibrio parahaemolyticus]
MIVIKKIIPKFVTLIGVIAAAIAIVQYFESKPSHDLTGQWGLNLVIQNTAYNPYQGLEVGYQVYLNQTGDEVTGTGEKITENLKDLPVSQRVKIDMQGRLVGAQLDLLFTLYGHKRDTIGQFRLTSISDDELEGTFSTTGAKASGSVRLTRTALVQN